MKPSTYRKNERKGMISYADCFTVLVDWIIDFQQGSHQFMLGERLHAAILI